MPYRDNTPPRGGNFNYDLTKDYGRVRDEVRELLNRLTAEQRVIFLQECTVAFCRDCGVILRGYGCTCQNDE